MEWLDFLEHFNAKNTKGKECFFAVIGKWLTRNESKDAGNS
jgi:hypothetical protein